MLNRISRVYLFIYTLMARQRPEEFASTATLTLAGTPATLAFSSASPALTDVIDIRRIYGVSGTVAAGVKIHLVPETEVYRTWQISPTVFRRGLSIVSRGASGDPANTDVIGVTVLDTPPALTTLATNIDARYPQRHYEILVNLGALYLETKDNGPRIGALQADLKMSMMALASEYNLDASTVEAALTDRVPAIPQATG